MFYRFFGRPKISRTYGSTISGIALQPSTLLAEVERSPTGGLKSLGRCDSEMFHHVSPMLIPGAMFHSYLIGAGKRMTSISNIQVCLRITRRTSTKNTKKKMVSDLACNFPISKWRRFHPGSPGWKGPWRFFSRGTREGCRAWLGCIFFRTEFGPRLLQLSKFPWKIFTKSFMFFEDGISWSFFWGGLPRIGTTKCLGGSCRRSPS